jgi:signal transduction histidine kinase
MQNMRWWDAAVIGITLITGGVLAVDPPYGPTEYGAWAALGALVALYFAYARRALQRPSAPHDLIVAALLAVVLGFGISFEPFLSFLQALAYPMVWVASTSMRRAIIGNIVVAVGVATGYYAWSGFENVLLALGVATLSVAFSVSLGLWITRIEQAGEERGRLLAELESVQDELAAMHRDAGVTSERERLAREIHDTLAQSLTGLVLLAQRASREIEPTDAATETISLIEQTAREALGEARALVAANAAVPVGSGLADAFLRLGERFARETGVRVETHVDLLPLDRDLEVVLLRCTQEALANVRKHAHATSARVRVISRDDEVILTIEDDGVGPAGAHEDAGFGVSGMRERLALVGGRLTLEPGETKGTVLRATVPARERKVDA